jgi:glycosyltransferase A (GT-A) superfamily protein (DUF2064 family)
MTAPSGREPSPDSSPKGPPKPSPRSPKQPEQPREASWGSPAPSPRTSPKASPRTSPQPLTTLLVIAKAPVPGRVKTRLTPAYTAQEAAVLAAAALRDTLAVGLELAVRRRVLVLAGEPGPWVPEEYEVVPQSGGGLDERLAAAFGLCDGPALLVGMDTPQIAPALLEPVLRSDGWAGRDAWFGPAADGGFWALGLADPARPDLLLGVPMSTARTGAVQRARLTSAGLRVQDLAVLRDVDTPADAAEVAALAPATRFAATWRALGPRGAAPSAPATGEAATPAAPAPAASPSARTTAAASGAAR